MKDYSCIVVTDGYQVYHSLEKVFEELRIAGCWSHARHCFANVVKFLGKEKNKGTLANDEFAASASENVIGILSTQLDSAKTSAIIYSIAETAKANNLKPYKYFELLLTEIQKHLEDNNLNFLEDLLPWSKGLPIKCKSKIYNF